MVQQLHPPVYLQRIHFCNWYNNNLLDNVDQQDISFFTDEAWFHLSGFINSQNYRTWSAHNPHNVIQVPLHLLKIGVWVAMSRTLLCKCLNHIRDWAPFLRHLYKNVVFRNPINNYISRDFRLN
jgi:hypothetical protein